MAPACVAACPEGAIAIEIVNVEEWRRDYLSANAPGLPSADDSISTTRVTFAGEPTARYRPGRHAADRSRTSSLAAGFHAGTFAACRGGIRNAIGTGLVWSRRRSLAIGIGIAGLGRAQPGRREAASGPADLCFSRAEGAAAILVEP